MKKLFLILLLISFINCFKNNPLKQQITYRLNPNLQTIKAGYKGNIIIDGIYCNSGKKDKPPVWDVIKWKLSTNPQRSEKRLDRFKVDIVHDFSFKRNSSDVIMWLGHACFFIRINNLTYITDPCMADLPIAKRQIKNPYSISDLGKIDYLLVSHIHLDHFNVETVKNIIKKNPQIEILGPLGISSFLKDMGFNSIRVQEAGWFQQFNTNNQNRVCFLPAKHWNRRKLFDFNKVLWGSFAISSNNYNIYFAGDTGSGAHFSEIHQLYPQFDICILPIAAYSPRFLMEAEHINPTEALNAFNELNGNVLIPMHFGTYDLSDEPLGEPIRWLNERATQLGARNKIINQAVGQPIFIEEMLDTIKVNNKTPL